MADIVLKPGTCLHFAFKNGFVDGQTVVVGGVAGDSRFGINLMTESGSLALHINPRQDEGEVVLNSLVDGEWGAEERLGWPVAAGEEFKINVHAVDGEYKIKVNGGDPTSFTQRVPTAEVLHVQVEGDLSLTKLTLKN